MLGLTATALQHFTLDTYGHEAWTHAEMQSFSGLQWIFALSLSDNWGPSCEALLEQRRRSFNSVVFGVGAGLQ